MTARESAIALGGSGRSCGGWYPCDCPACGGEGKLGLKDTESGLAVNCFRLCRHTDIIAELDRRGLLLDEPAEPEDPAVTERRKAKEEAHRQRRIAEARDFIGECLPWNATGQIARYLRRRGIDPSLPSLSPSIMFHGMSRHPEGGSRPLMVGVIEHVEYGVIGATRTFLAIDGSQKAAFHKPRLFLGMAKGGAVRLGTPDPDREIVVGEGIESTISYMELHGLPGWAALSACGIAGLILPPEARRVVIAAHHDEDGVGLKAAVAAARRWRGEMRRVRIDLPPDAGSDWNDVLASRRGVTA